MENLLENFAYREDVIKILEAVQNWLMTHVFVMASLIQLGLLVVVSLVVWMFAGKLKRLIEALVLPGYFQRYQYRTKAILKPIIVPFVWMILLWFCVFALRSVAIESRILTLFVSLLNAWVVIRLASSLIQRPGLSRFVSVCAWTVAALNIVGLLDVTMEFLDSLSFAFGEFKFSMLGVVKGIIAVAILFWVFSLLEGVIKRRVDVMTGLTPSAKVLLKKFLRIALIVIGILFSMDAMGIDLTALAVFSGAIGIGLGFGLQKVAANLVSGVILLLDRSVKPGDVISLGNTYGRIDKLGGRYVSVITRDGTETLIPNEELITQRVENWSFSDTNVRQKTMIGVDYSTDIKKAMELCVEAGMEVDRIVKDPAPRCLLREFADSSVNIELRFWVSDAENGLGNVRSEVLMKIWDKFHENGVAFPYPQRDIHIKGTVPLRFENGGVSLGSREDSDVS